jgi:ABC-type polysaccharide/polyol phosphate transport system ATPase subunit
MTLQNAISVEEAIEAAAATAPVPAPGADAPLAIEVTDLHKSFRIPKNRITNFKERAVRPFERQEYWELHALRGISFDVRQGEFFGIVGRNGSGKSTLLKILASIYKADSGTIRMAGRPAPFIELGVGFDPELTARENVVLNGVMMGLSRREAARRLDAVLDFAELGEFVDLKLKNYSSGMHVRLAFSTMLQAPESDILLIDEVLAVGDASFQEKCAQVFREMRDGGRTIVLVTHDMAAVEGYCHRALVIDDGRIRHIGDPEEAGKEYLRLNFERSESGYGRQEGIVPDRHARLVDAWLEDESGARIPHVEAGHPIHFGVTIEARDEWVDPVLGFHCYTADHTHVFGFNRSPEADGDGPVRVAPGQRVTVSGTIESPLLPDRYLLRCWVARDRASDRALQSIDLLDFVVFGMRTAGGLVSVPVEAEVVIDGGRR